MPNKMWTGNSLNWSKHIKFIPNKLSRRKAMCATMLRRYHFIQKKYIPSCHQRLQHFVHLNGASRGFRWRTRDFDTPANSNKQSKVDEEGREIKNSVGQIKTEQSYSLQKVASKYFVQTMATKLVGGGGEGFIWFRYPLTCSVVNESLGSCGKPQPPPKNDSPQKWCGQDPLYWLPPPIWVFWEEERGAERWCQKDRRLGMRLGEGEGRAKQLMQAIDQFRGLHFLGTPPPSNWQRGPSVVLSGRPEKAPSITYFFPYYYFFCLLQYGWLPEDPHISPWRPSSKKMHPLPLTCLGGFYITNGHRYIADIEWIDVWPRVLIGYRFIILRRVKALTLFNIWDS